MAVHDIPAGLHLSETQSSGIPAPGHQTVDYTELYPSVHQGPYIRVNDQVGKVQQLRQYKCTAVPILTPVYFSLIV